MHLYHESRGADATRPVNQLESSAGLSAGAGADVGGSTLLLSVTATATASVAVTVALVVLTAVETPGNPEIAQLACAQRVHKYILSGG